MQDKPQITSGTTYEVGPFKEMRMDDYDWVTDDMFDMAMTALLDARSEPSAYILSIPGVYELVREDMNDEVLSYLEENRER